MTRQLSQAIQNHIAQALPDMDMSNCSHLADGNANDIYQMGEALLVKVAKTNPRGQEVNDLNTERDALLALAHLDYVPRILAYNTELNYYAYTSLPGEELKPHMPTNPQIKKQLGHALGQFLAVLHQQGIDTQLTTTPNKNYHQRRPHQHEKIALVIEHDSQAKQLLHRLYDIIDAAPNTPKYLKLTHSDFHWKNILVEPNTLALTGVIDFGNICWDRPEVDFRQLMGRYDFELGQHMVRAYEAATGYALDKNLLHAHCALNDLWHHYGRHLKPLDDGWLKKWKVLI